MRQHQRQQQQVVASGSRPGHAQRDDVKQTIALPVLKEAQRGQHKAAEQRVFGRGSSRSTGGGYNATHVHVGESVSMLHFSRGSSSSSAKYSQMRAPQQWSKPVCAPVAMPSMARQVRMPSMRAHVATHAGMEFGRMNIPPRVPGVPPKERSIIDITTPPQPVRKSVATSRSFGATEMLRQRSSEQKRKLSMLRREQKGQAVLAGDKGGKKRRRRHQQDRNEVMSVPQSQVQRQSETRYSTLR